MLPDTELPITGMLAAEISATAAKEAGRLWVMPMTAAIFSLSFRRMISAATSGPLGVLRSVREVLPRVGEQQPDLDDVPLTAVDLFLGGRGAPAATAG
ncbi:hypothetical protein GCM10020254_70450 [Streptomyces goshikiensis]